MAVHVGVGEHAQFFELEPDGEAAAGERDADRVSSAGQPDQAVALSSRSARDAVSGPISTWPAAPRHRPALTRLAQQ